MSKKYRLLHIPSLRKSSASYASIEIARKKLIKKFYINPRYLGLLTSELFYLRDAKHHEDEKPLAINEFMVIEDNDV